MNAQIATSNVAKSTKVTETKAPKTTEISVVADKPKAEKVKTAVDAKPEAPKQTAIEDRLYTLASFDGEPMKFRGKQRQAVYESLLELKAPSTIAQVAKLAAKKGLEATGGVEPSVRYHLHHMTNDGVTVVTNLTPTE